MPTESSESTILWVRFQGERLDKQSVPIYDLAQVFIALQRIVNKAYLFKEGRLVKGERLNQAEQEELALQLRERQRGSDIYGLASFLADHAAEAIVVPILLEGLFALSRYAAQRVAKRDGKPAHAPRQQAPGNRNAKAESESASDERQQEFSGLIYPQAKELVGRIDGTAGIRVIEIYPTTGALPPLRLDSETKEYVRNIESECFLGELRTLKGALRTLIPSQNLVTIQRARNDMVRVHVNQHDFDLIRYTGEKNAIITFSGRPMYKLGLETTEFHEFEAYSVKLEERKTPKKTRA